MAQTLQIMPLPLALLARAVVEQRFDAKQVAVPPIALLALISLSSGAGTAITWIFNLWGTADLLNAFYQANRAGLLAGQLGATYFIPTLVVPLLLITHALAFRILLTPENESVTERLRQTA